MLGKLLMEKQFTATQVRLAILYKMDDIRETNILLSAPMPYLHLCHKKVLNLILSCVYSKENIKTDNLTLTACCFIHITTSSTKANVMSRPQRNAKIWISCYTPAEVVITPAIFIS